MITLSTANDLDSDWIKHANLESARAEVKFHLAYAKALPVQTSLDRIHRIANPKISNSSGKPCGQSHIEAGDTCHVGEPSALKPGDTSTPEFKEWFSGSKVVHEDGTPKIVYHGTAGNISEFEDRPAYFGDNKENASFYADTSVVRFLDEEKHPNVIPVYLSIRNPKKYSGTTNDTYDHWTEDEAQGFDGYDMGGGLWVPFHSTQIKSVFNKGSWSKSDANISNSGKPCGHSFISADKTCWGDKSDPSEIERKARRSVQKTAELEWLKQNHPDTLTQAEAYIKKAELKLPAFEKLLNDVSSGLGGHIKANTKSAKSLALKVVRHNRPDYGFSDPKDHVRGTVMLTYWDKVPELADALSARGRFKGESTLINGYNTYGYRALMISTKLGDGINGEIQLHTPESWNLKKQTDEIYAKYRKYDGIEQKTLPKELQKEIKAGQKKSSQLWDNYWGKVSEPIKAAASSA